MDACVICTEVCKVPTNLDCKHQFCYRCILEWAKLNNVCPLCKQAFTVVYKFNKYAETVRAPLKSYEETLLGQTYGPRRPRLPWDRQRDLAGFVVQALSESEEDPTFGRDDSSEEVEYVSSEEIDEQPIYTRTRSVK